jgi:hypothetical protein
MEGTPGSLAMDIPFSLSSPRPHRLVYGFPAWYRVAMGAVLAILGAGLAAVHAAPGAGAWTVLGLVALAGLYEDRWEFDGEAEVIRHRTGLVFAARARTLPFAQVERFQLVPFGPARVFEKGRDLSLTGRLAARGRVDLVLECTDGRRLFLDRHPAREAARLRSQAERIAALCGKPLADG